MKEMIPKRALSLITPPNQNLTLHHQAATQTINSHSHSNLSPLKKTLNLISLSYWKVEREIRLNDALLPLRRPQMMHSFKGHDSLRKEMLNRSEARSQDLGQTFFYLSVGWIEGWSGRPNRQRSIRGLIPGLA